MMRSWSNNLSGNHYGVVFASISWDIRSLELVSVRMSDHWCYRRASSTVKIVMC